MPGSDHPTREIVLPLAVVVGLIINSLLVGVSWGRLGQKLEIVSEGSQATAKALAVVDGRVRVVETATHDMQRDQQREQEDVDATLRAFDDFLRGHLGRSVYRAPPPSESLLRRRLKITNTTTP